LDGDGNPVNNTAAACRSLWMVFQQTTWCCIRLEFTFRKTGSWQRASVVVIYVTAYYYIIERYTVHTIWSVQSIVK
jgi:hypothetical protein